MLRAQQANDIHPNDWLLIFVLTPLSLAEWLGDTKWKNFWFELIIINYAPLFRFRVTYNEASRFNESKRFNCRFNAFHEELMLLTSLSYFTVQSVEQFFTVFLIYIAINSRFRLRISQFPTFRGDFVVQKSLLYIEIA